MDENIVLVKTENYFYPEKFIPRENASDFFDDAAVDSDFIYEMVKKGFFLMGMDRSNYNKKEWNPLKDLIRPGDCVLIKPNLVMHENRNMAGGQWCLYTQPDVVAAVIHYVIIALQGKGDIIIGDAPMQSCDFDALIKNSGYQKMVRYYKKLLEQTDVSISLVDFRGLRSTMVEGVIQSQETNEKGIVVEMGKESEFLGEKQSFFDNIRITNYDPQILKEHHSTDKNEYCVSQYILDADVIINMPKPKTHRKAGITASLKNIVGISSRKEYLPHHTNGAIIEGGDEYLYKNIVKRKLDHVLDRRNYYQQTAKDYNKAKRLGRYASVLSKFGKLFSKDHYYEGSWYGNDTISRTIVDLNKIIFYADKNGILQQQKQRKYLIIADMIVAGEKEGPLEPSPKNVGLIVMGQDPVCFDETIAKMMGAKEGKIPTLVRARSPKGVLRLTSDGSRPFLISNDIRWNNKHLSDLKSDELLYFKPTSGWKKVFH